MELTYSWTERLGRTLSGFAALIAYLTDYDGYYAQRPGAPSGRLLQTAATFGGWSRTPPVPRVYRSLDV
jgi:hypothetical protein